MAYYPILLDLKGKTALVVGGGAVAERKVQSLLDFDARVSVVSREVSPTLKGLFENGSATWVGREFDESQLKGATLVIAATDDASVNRHVKSACGKFGIPVNIVDRPADCSFIVPAVVRRGDLVLAISTSGKSPALAAAVREELENLYGLEYGDFLVIMGSVREDVLSLGLEQEVNKEIFQKLLKSGLLEAVRRKDWTSAARTLTQILGTAWTEVDVLERLEQSERRRQQWP